MAELVDASGLTRFASGELVRHKSLPRDFTDITDVFKLNIYCPNGGIGRRKGLKIPRDIILYRFDSGFGHFQTVNTVYILKAIRYQVSPFLLNTILGGSKKKVLLIIFKPNYLIFMKP